MLSWLLQAIPSTPDSTYNTESTSQQPTRNCENPICSSISFPIKRPSAALHIGPDSLVYPVWVFNSRSTVQNPLYSGIIVACALCYARGLYDIRRPFI